MIFLHSYICFGYFSKKLKKKTFFLTNVSEPENAIRVHAQINIEGRDTHNWPQLGSWIWVQNIPGSWI